MIRILGQSEFGLYSVLGSLAAYFSVMDMGLGNAMVRFTSRNRAIGNNDSEARLNGLFLMLYTLIGIITIIVGVIVYNNVVTLFGSEFSDVELAKAKLMVIVLTFNFSLSFPLSIFSSIIRAYERFVVDKIVSIIRIILSPILILPFIYIGFGAVSMVVITTIVNISCLLFNFYYSIKKLNIKFYFGKIDKSLLMQILGYSFFVFLGVIVDQINWQTDQIILGAIRGTAPVAVYAIAMQFIKLYIKFSTSISGLFLPKVSMMVAKNASGDELTNIMIKFGRIQYIIVTFILGGFILFGLPFIEFWAGNSYSSAYYIVLIIMLPLTIPLVQNIGITILYAKNLQKFRSLVLILIAISNVLFSIPLAKIYGGIGVAFATSGTLIVGNIVIMNIYYAKKIGINIILFWRNLFRLTFVTILSTVIGFVMHMFILSNSIYILFLEMIIFAIIHISILYKLGFNEYENHLFNSVISRIFKLINKIIKR